RSRRQWGPRVSARGFSFSRIGAIMVKEFIQMRRDRLTFAMIIGVPIIQLVLFGYAINTDPKRLPTVAVLAEQGPATRAILSAMENSNYFEIRDRVASESEARAALARGEAAYVFTIPAGFERDLMRGRRPQIVM